MLAAIRLQAPTLSVRQLCALVGVSRSWYRARPAALVPTQEDTALRDVIERLVLAFPGYGYRRVTHALVRDGWTINHKKVLRVMREESLLCRLQRQFVTTTDARHHSPVYPNLLAGVVLERLDQAWVADITSIRLPTHFVYLASILDAYSRRCRGPRSRGGRLSRDIDTARTLAALEHALARRQPTAGLVHHADRGVQYASSLYVDRLRQAGATVSMAAPGNPYDNATAASFFKTLKRAEVALNNYRTFDEAQAQIGRFIEDVYNDKRLHSSLGYVPPAEFEATLVRKAKR